MRKRLVILAALVVTLGSAGAYYAMRRNTVEPQITTAPVTTGEIIDSVGATGTLQAVTTVQVGTQVSGTIQALYADFNSIVKKGQVVARLEPSLFQTQIEQARANLIRAEADVDRLRVALDDANTKLRRADELSKKKLIPDSDLDAAQIAVRSADAQVKSAQAQVVQSRASLSQNEVNLEHTVITAPINGIVISRNVDVGQTVAASMQAPTLFIIAADLTKMQVNASVDEADVGRIRPAQTVRFRVDAFPTEEFIGRVSQIRLQPTVVQNVVTYGTVIDVPNLDLKLKPGMTATVTIEIARRANAIRVPNTALRFRPTSDMFAALGQTAPQFGPEAHPGGQAGTPAGDSSANAARAGWQDRAARSREGSAPGGGPREDAAPRAETPARPAAGGTIDSLFGPLPPVESVGRVWLYMNKQLKPVRLRLGISDGTFTELLSGELTPGTELVTNIVTGKESKTSSAGRSPLLGPQRPPGGGGRPSGTGGTGR